jgi:hypothetical protein
VDRADPHHGQPQCRIVRVHGKVGAVWGQMGESNCNTKPETCAHFRAVNEVLGAWVSSRMSGFLLPPGRPTVLDMRNLSINE